MGELSGVARKSGAAPAGKIEWGVAGAPLNGRVVVVLKLTSPSVGAVVCAASICPQTIKMKIAAASFFMITMDPELELGENLPTTPLELKR